MQSVQLFLEVFVIILCLAVWALALWTLVRALLLGRVLIAIPIVATITSLLLSGLIHIGDILRFGGASALVLLAGGITSLFILNIDNVYNIDIIVIRTSWLLVVVVVRMNRIRIEITNILCLRIKLIVVSEMSLWINDLNLFVQVFVLVHILIVLHISILFYILVHLFLWA